MQAAPALLERGMPFARRSKILFLSLILTCAVFLGNGCANGLFYHPSSGWAPTPDQRGLAYKDVSFASGDGTRLSGWWLPAPGEAKGTVIHFHGNAGNMSTHVRFADWLPAAGYNLFVFDYRGYGKSGGRPSRRGLAMDAAAALQWISKSPDVDPTRLLVWGQSLGGTAALQGILISGVEVRGMLIDSAFSSHRRIASEKIRELPWYLQPLRLLLPLFISGGYDADDALRKLPPIPVVFLHGEADRVVPAHHSQALYDLAKGPKDVWLIPGARHTEAIFTNADTLRPRLLEFFQRVLTPPPPAP